MAAIHHPHVVQVHTYGEAPATDFDPARPYMVLEYLAGGTLQDRLRLPEEANRNTIGRRLDSQAAAELIGKVSSGVAAAHELGIVHRDLKPGNILFEVTGSDIGSGNPKVADFGLVKRDGGSNQTRTGDFLGTPAYMAPEQGVGRAKYVGPPADVWALGVILYECLTGVRPFQDSDTRVLLRKVAQEAPVRPRTLAPDIPRDLELICLKCLSKEPNDRYPTAAALVEDLERFRRGKPVQARPIGPLVLFLRWTRRNPAMTAMLAAVLLISAWLVLAMIERNERALKHAEAELQVAEQRLQVERLDREKSEAQLQVQAQERAADQILGLLTEVFRSADPIDFFTDGFISDWGKQRDKTADIIAREATEKVRAGLKDQPLIQARLLARLGNTLKNLNEVQQSQKALTEVLEIRERLLGPVHPDTIQSRLDLGRLYLEQGDILAALRLFRQGRDDYEKSDAPGENILTAKLYEAIAMTVVGDPAAEAIFKDVIAGRDELFTPAHRHAVFARMSYLAFLLDQHRGVGELAPLIVEVLKGLEAQPNGQFVRVAQMTTKYQTAVVIHSQRSSNKTIANIQLEKAEALLKDCVADGCLPPDHPALFFVRFHLAIVQQDLGKDEAEQTFSELVATMRKIKGLSHPKALVVVERYIARLARTGRVEEARKLYQEVDQAGLDRFGADNYWRPMLLLLRVVFEANHKGQAKAIAIARDAIGMIERNVFIPNRETAVAMHQAAVALGKGSAPAQTVAIRLFELCAPLLKSTFGEHSEEQVILLRDHGDQLFQMSRRLEGATMLREARERAAKLARPLDEWDQRRLRIALGRVSAAAGDFADAEKQYAAALAFSRSGKSGGLWDRINDARMLAGAMVGLGRAREAIPVLEEAREWTAHLKPIEWELVLADRQIATVRLLTGDREGCLADVTRMVAKYAKSTNLNSHSQLARAAGLFDRVPGWEAGDTARKHTGSLNALGHRTKALSFLRAGETLRAELELKAAAAATKSDDPLDEAIRGLAAIQRGDQPGARSALQRADLMIETAKPSTENPFPYAGTAWLDRLTTKLLLDDLRNSVTPKGK